MNDFWVSITTLAVSLITASISLLITIIKTKQSSIEKKVDCSLNNNTKKDFLEKYYIVIDNKKYYLKDLTIFKDSKVTLEKEE